MTDELLNAAQVAQLFARFEFAICARDRAGQVLVPARQLRIELPRLTLVVMTMTLLTEGDLDRGRPPDVTSPHWRCGIVDPTTGAVCTRRPHPDDELHKGRAAMQGAGRSSKIVTWTRGTERALVVDGYRWSRVPGTNVEVRALTERPLALRYRHR